jgi:hypothetical protein
MQEATSQDKRWGYFSAGILVILLVWLVAYARRPFLLGFYHDDWALGVGGVYHGAAFSLERLSWYLKWDASRPVEMVVCFLFSSLGGDSPFLWHLLSAFTALGVALTLRAFLRSMLRLLGNETELWVGDLGAALWLVLPWTLGATAFVTLNTSLFSGICFALCGCVLFDAWRRGKSGWWLASVFYLLGALTYENFYGQFVVLLLIGFVAGAHRRIGTRAFILSAVALGAAQALAFGWNQVYRHVASSAVVKEATTSWLPYIKGSIKWLPIKLLDAAAEVQLPLVALLAAWLVILCVSLAQVSRDKRRQVLWIIALCGLGAVLTAVVLAFGRYSFETRGVFSRTTLALSFWLVIGFAVAHCLLSSIWKKIAIGATCGIVALLAVSQFFRVNEWAHVWRIQQQILAAAPLTELLKTDSNAVILYDGPFEHAGVVVFGASWDITPAMNHTHPELTRDGVRLQFTPNRRDWVTVWDGQALLQTNPTLVFRVEPSEVWLWNFPKGELTKLQPPWTSRND